MKKYFIEFIGAFFLILTVALTGNPIAIGFVLATLVYMGGYISGGHYNPAVTLAVLFIKKIDTRSALIYMIAQVLGGFVAAAAYLFIMGTTFVPTLGERVEPQSALFVEILFTFLLAFVVLNVAVTEKTKGNDYYGLAIGLALMVGAFAAGPVSGGVFNPAVAVGPMLFDFEQISTNAVNLLIYIAGPLLGGALAGLIYKIK